MRRSIVIRAPVAPRRMLAVRVFRAFFEEDALIDF
jgi:hypothetical protein